MFTETHVSSKGEVRLCKDWLGTSFFPNCQHAYSLKSHGGMFVRDNGQQCRSWGTKTLFKLSVGPLLQSHRYCVAVEVAGRQAEAQSRTEA